MSHTNYNDISNKNAKAENVANTPNVTPEAKLPETVANTTPETQEPEKKDPVLGVVADCVKLNVRKSPNPNAEILFVIGKDSDVLIDIDESTADWYKVYVNEQEGFCMKKYIKLAQ